MTRCFGVCAVVAVGVVLFAVTGGGVSAAACTLTPTLQSSTITQGLNSYSVLGRGKETLVRLYLSLPSCAATTNAIRVNSAQATVTVKDAASGAVQSTTTLSPTAPIPDSAGNYPQITNLTPLAAVASSDPMFVIPGSLLAPAGDVNRLTIGITATIGYQVLPSGAPASLTLPAARQTAITRTVEKRTNALRVLVVPFGNPLDQTSNANLQNALTTVSRLLPVADGTTLPPSASGTRVGSLSTLSGGLRYSINAGTLNLAALGVSLPFCGTGANFGTTSNPPNPNSIRGQLAQFMTSWNAVNDADHKVDKVLGTVNEADSTSSVAKPSCYEGMASLTSPEAWVRASAFAGGIGGMELLHTFGVVPFARSDGGYHSPNVQADTAAADVNKGYNVTDRTYQSDDRTVMYFSPPGYGNSNVLLEPGDWSNILCKLGGATNSECTTAGVAGTATGVSAGAPPPAFNIVAVTDGRVANVVESFVAPVPKTQPGDPTSSYTIQQFNASGGLLGTPAKIDLSVTDTHHGGGGDLDGSASATGLIAASVPLNPNTKVVKLLNGSTVLYSATQTGAPVVTDVTATPGSGQQVKPGDIINGGTTLAIPAIAKTPDPKPDVYLLADTTASMTGAIGDVKSSAASIVNNYAGKTGTQPCFGVGDYKDFVGSDYAFNNALTFGCSSDSTQATAATNAINAWAVSGGGDTPEAQLYALHRLANGDAAFQSDSQKTLIWFGDQPGHDPICGSVYGSGDGVPPDITTDSVKAELAAAGIKVFPIGVTASPDTFKALDADPGSGGYLGCPAAANASLQATRIANATGGVVTLAPSSQVSETILNILNNEVATVTPSASCQSGISITFSPTIRTALTPATVGFSHPVTIASNATPGIHTCTITFAVSVNGTPRPALNQTVTVSYDVTGFTGPHSLLSWNTSDPGAASNDKYDVKYDVALNCDGVKSILAVALTTAFYDTNATCPGGGAGTYQVIANDGYSQGQPAGAGTPLTQPAQVPVAAISSPVDQTTIGEHSALSLTGSGYDYKSGAPIPPSGLRWTIDGSAAGTGPQIAFKTGLAVGSHSIALEVTDSNGTPAIKTVTITSVADADGDLLTADQEAALDACKPTGAPAGESDPTNGSKDWDGDGIPNRDDPAPCTPSPIQGLGLFARNPFKLSGTDNFSVSGILVPGVDLGLATPSSVQLAEIAGQPINPIANSGWLALNQIGAALFSHSAVATALAPFVGHTVRLKLVGTGPAYSFYVYFDVTVAP